jgi:hypothetical protein
VGGQLALDGGGEGVDVVGALWRRPLTNIVGVPTAPLASALSMSRWIRAACRREGRSLPNRSTSSPRSAA